MAEEYQLNIQVPNQPSVEKRINKDSITLGSAPDNDIQLSHPTVSRKHARIYYQDGSYIIQDLNSRNGSFYNQQRLEQPLYLNKEQQSFLRLGAVQITYTPPVAGTQLYIPPARNAIDTPADDEAGTVFVNPLEPICTVTIENKFDKIPPFPLKKTPFSIGRGKQNDIVLTDPSVSRKHLLLDENKQPDAAKKSLGNLMAKSSESVASKFVAKLDPEASGTLVINGKPLNEKIIEDGDIIFLGNTKIKFVVKTSIEDVNALAATPTTASPPSNKRSLMAVAGTVLLLCGISGAYFWNQFANSEESAIKDLLFKSDQLRQNHEFDPAQKLYSSFLQEHPHLSQTARMQVLTNQSLLELAFGIHLWQKKEFDSARAHMSTSLKILRGEADGMNALKNLEEQISTSVFKSVDEQLAERQWQTAQADLNWLAKELDQIQNQPAFAQRVNRVRALSEVEQLLAKATQEFNNKTYLAAGDTLASCIKLYQNEAAQCQEKLKSVAEHLANESQQHITEAGKLPPGNTRIKTILQEALTKLDKAVTYDPENKIYPQQKKNVEEQLNRSSFETFDLFDKSPVNIDKFKRK
ncbi:MAG: FHA domain-containing protein [Magnetococcus sp. YQC-5]